MKKIKLKIADSDSTYMDAVVGYLRGTADSLKFDVKLFTSTQLLSQELSVHDQVDILLISPELFSEKLPFSQVSTVLLLEDERITRSTSNMRSVFKYQPLNQLISEVLSHYYDQNGKVQSFVYEMGRTKILSMYSASGGAGKTTLAVSLARQLAMINKKVFYLNLELINSTSLYLTSQDDQPSTQILYHVKEHKDQLVSKIEALKKYSPEMRVEYFDLAINPEEMQELSEDDLNTLVTGLVETKNYDFIIIDLDSSLDVRIKAALKLSDFILWVMNNEKQSFYKTEQLLKRSNLLSDHSNNLHEKIIFILNQFTGDHAEEFKSDSIKINEFTPFISDWKQLKSGSQLLKTTLFSEEFLNQLGVQTQGGVIYGR